MRMETAELRECGRLKDIRTFMDDLYGHDLHAQRGLACRSHAGRDDGRV